jgi:hypothetical protein
MDCSIQRISTFMWSQQNFSVAYRWFYNVGRSVARIVVRWLALRQAPVRISARLGNHGGSEHWACSYEDICREGPQRMLLVNGCLNVRMFCNRLRNIQKEWHKATKPLILQRAFVLHLEASVYRACAAPVNDCLQEIWCCNWTCPWACAVPGDAVSTEFFSVTFRFVSKQVCLFRSRFETPKYTETNRKIVYWFHETNRKTTEKIECRFVSFWTEFFSFVWGHL